ncbi:GIY-YIG nuclease family protein [Gaetbulibacter sp. M235]
MNNKLKLYIGVTNNIQKRLSQHYFDSQNEKNLLQENITAFF